MLPICRVADNVNAKGIVKVVVKTNTNKDSVPKIGPKANKTLDITSKDKSKKLVKQAITLIVSCLSMSILHASRIKLSLFQIARGPLFLS